MPNQKTRIVFLLCMLLLARGASSQSLDCSAQGITNALAPWYCNEINQAVASVWSMWSPIAFFAMMLAFLLAAVMLMMGIAMRNEKLRNFAISELYEAIASALIVVLFLLLSGILFGIIPAFVTGPINPYVTALTYIHNTITVTQNTIVSLYNVIMIDSFYSSVTIDISIGSGSATGTTLSSLSKLLNPLAQEIMYLFIIPAQVINGLLLEGLLALTAEFYMILFFMYISIPVLLVPGIIFRSIFPLRSIGGMLIGMAVAFYLVLPILFSIAYYFTNVGIIQSLAASSASIIANSAGTQSQTNAASANAPLVTAVTGLQSSMGSYFLSIFFYPALILTITYFAMTTVAEFVGGVSKTTKRMGLI